MPQPGPTHPRWRGGRYIGSQGYVHVWVASRRYVREHRLIMEQMLGRPLAPGEVVHHLNHDRADNRPENLALYSNADHSKHHWDTDGSAGFRHIERGMATCHPDRPHYAKTQCRQCYMLAAQKKYAAEHPEQVREKDRRYRQEHRAERAEYKRRRRAAGLTA